MQIPNKKCGALCHTNSFKLHESEVINSIYVVAKQEVFKYLLVSTVSCQIYVINYQSCQQIHKFDMQLHRTLQLELATDSMAP